MNSDRADRLGQRGGVNRRAFLRVAGGAAAVAGVAGLPAFGRRGVARAAEPKRGGTLRILQIEPAVGFNPALEGGNWPETQRLVYNGLTDFNPASELVPGLARSWTYSEGADVFTFQLMPGVKFHDGKDLTAEDVKFTFEMVVDSNAGSPFASYLPNLKSVDAPEKDTVTFKFNGPNVLFMPALSALGIVPKHLWSGSDPKKSPYLVKPVGTGPFMLKEWQRSDHLTFVANPNYFRKPKPYLDQVIFKVVTDAATGIEAFKNGELDAVFGQGVPGGLPYGQVRQLIQAKPANMAVSEFNQAFSQLLWMNCAKPPFDNVKVRRALAHAINKELIIKALLQGFGQAQPSIIGDLPGLKWAHDPSIRGYEYNPAKANQLLDEAGFPKKGSTRFPVTILATEGFRVKLSEALRAMLAAVGIESSIKSYTWATYIARIRQDRDTAGCIWTIFNSRQVDPSVAVINLNGQGIAPGGENWAQWNHPKATELISAARSVADQAKRKPLYMQVQKIVEEEVPVIPLYSAVGIDLSYQYVQSLQSVESLTGTMQSVEGVWLDKA
jgi:peptide/nickel transport system substrate-binding protein